jgi:hypothetical protein
MSAARCVAALRRVVWVLRRPFARRPTPELTLPATWTPAPRTIVHTHHLRGGRSW